MFKSESCHHSHPFQKEVSKALPFLLQWLPDATILKCHKLGRRNHTWKKKGLKLDYPGSLKPKGEQRWFPFRSLSLLLPWLVDGSLHIHIQFYFIFTASFLHVDFCSNPCCFVIRILVMLDRSLL